MLPSNNERTGDRDLWWSETMRLPDEAAFGCRGLRSLDFDPHLFCDICSLPVFLVEATRETGFKATRYIRTTAQQLGVPAYLVRHDGLDALQVTNLITNEARQFTRQGWKTWCEEKFRQHAKERHVTT